MLASYASSVGTVIDWSEEEWPNGRYTGALVLEPLMGLHHDVSVLDVGAMYPSIMIDANVSMETMRTCRLDAEGSTDAVNDTVVDWDHRLVYVQADGLRSQVLRQPVGIVGRALVHLIETRKRAGKKTPTGWALKIGTNSMYGALGSSTSRLQSFSGASAVTAIGRMITILASSLAKAMGFATIYGDTDSVFLTKVSMNHITVQHYLNTIHLVLLHTPFRSVKMEYEKSFDSFISVKPKMYYGTLRDGTEGTKAEVKGLAPVRKDRPEIVRRLVSEVCKHICTYGADAAEYGVMMLVSDDTSKIESGEATVSTISRSRTRAARVCPVSLDMRRIGLA